MAIGASGNRIVALCRFISIQQLPNRTVDYSMSWRMSEPTVDGGPWDGEISSDNILNSTLEPTDSEIEAVCRSAVANFMNERYLAADPFLDTDIRGLKI